MTGVLPTPDTDVTWQGVPTIPVVQAVTPVGSVGVQVVVPPVGVQLWVTVVGGAPIFCTNRNSPLLPGMVVAQVSLTLMLSLVVQVDPL